MAGCRLAVPSTRHLPSPRSGWATSGVSGAGGGKDGAAFTCPFRGPVALGSLTGPALGPVSANEGFPPTFGGW